MLYLQLYPNAVPSAFWEWVVAVLKACTAAVLVGVVCLDSQAALSILVVPGAWSVSCVG